MESTTTVKNIHPTTKPISLLQYISMLILSPKRENDTRKLLVPFSGSGSEVIGAMLAGWEEIHAFELETDYIKIAEKRIEFWREHDLETYKTELNRKKENKKDINKEKLKETSWITNNNKEGE